MSRFAFRDRGRPCESQLAFSDTRFASHGHFWPLVLSTKAPSRSTRLLSCGSVPLCGAVSCIPACWNQQANHSQALLQQRFQ
ncbi:hypothetical protein BR93DRAFT_773320 [Coniochaeta sp. PMI_546]|nr:hypothetical protein BR93DRAFT_773320 [Coniochaeta sp. PMI_546]